MSSELTKKKNRGAKKSSPNSSAMPEADMTNKDKTPTVKNEVVKKKVDINPEKGDIAEVEFKTQIKELESEVKRYEPYISKFWKLALESYAGMGEIALKDILTKEDGANFIYSGRGKDKSFTQNTFIQRLLPKDEEGNKKVRIGDRAFKQRGGLKEKKTKVISGVLTALGTGLAYRSASAATGSSFPFGIIPGVALTALAGIVSASVMRDIWRLSKDIRKTDIEHIFKESNVEEIDFALLSRNFFRFDEKSYIDFKKSGPRSQFLLQDKFNEWFTKSEGDPKTRRNNIKLKLLHQYFVTRLAGMGEGIYYDKEKDVMDIFGETLDDLFKLVKNTDKRFTKFKPPMSIADSETMFKEFFREWETKFYNESTGNTAWIGEMKKGEDTTYANNDKIKQLNIRSIKDGYATPDPTLAGQGKIPELVLHPSWPRPQSSYGEENEYYDELVNGLSSDSAERIKNIITQAEMNGIEGYSRPSLEDVKTNIMNREIEAARKIWDRAGMGNNGLLVAKLFCGLRNTPEIREALFCGLKEIQANGNPPYRNRRGVPQDTMAPAQPNKREAIPAGELFTTLKGMLGSNDSNVLKELGKYCDTSNSVKTAGTT